MFDPLPLSTDGSNVAIFEERTINGYNFPQGYSKAIDRSDLRLSGLSVDAFMAAYGMEAQREKVQAACAKLSAEMQAAVRAVRERVSQDKLPLLSLLQAEPLQMQSSHLSFQEYFTAHAICKGAQLPSSTPPWQWGPVPVPENSNPRPLPLHLSLHASSDQGCSLLRVASLNPDSDSGGQIRCGSARRWARSFGPACCVRPVSCRACLSATSSTYEVS